MKDGYNDKETKKYRAGSLPQDVVKYLSACSDKFQWPTYETYVVSKLTADRDAMIKSLDFSDYKGEYQSYGDKNNYETALDSILKYCVERDIESPAVDSELRWLSKFWKEKKPEIARLNKEFSQKWNTEPKETRPWRAPEIKIKINEGLVKSVHEYKALAWDRREPVTA
jgi:hypothetical protein